MKPVTQGWTHKLSFMQQSVLLTSLRGPDGISKNHISKVLIRWLRRCILYRAFDSKISTDPYEKGGGSFTGPCTFEDINLAVTGYLNTLDEVPHHFQLHFLHAAEILGYKHPDTVIKNWWHQDVYLRLVNDMHLNPETIDQMNKRLGDSEQDWRDAEEVTAK